MKSIKYLLIAVTAIILVDGCKKSEHCINYHYNTAAQKDYYSFKTGSYWIMKDSLTGEIDSFVATSRPLGYYDDYVNTGCTDRFDEKNIDFDVYDDATKAVKHQLFVTMHFIGTSQTMVYNKYGVVTHFDIVPNSFNVAINGHSYDSVFIGDGNATAFSKNIYVKNITNANEILLQVSSIDDYNSVRQVWQLVSAHVIH